jgi:DNA-binding transcriptional MocR family regulator
MTPDSKKKTTTKIPAKKKVAKKTAVSAMKAPTKKTARKTPVSAKVTTAKKVGKKSKITSKPNTPPISITPEERWKMIAIAAYHKAENRGFSPGGELQDWAEAEQEIDELLMSG